MIIEDGKFYFIKDDFFEIFKKSRGINIPFYNIIEMKEILLKKQN